MLGKYACKQQVGYPGLEMPCQQACPTTQLKGPASDVKEGTIVPGSFGIEWSTTSISRWNKVSTIHKYILG
jgi:hypothetical protein